MLFRSELADAAFALDVGAVSGPVATQSGVYLLKVEEKQAASSRPLEEVKVEIARALYVKEQAQSLSEAAARAAIARAQGGASLTALYPPEKEGKPALLRFETETRPEAVETDSFTAAGESVPHLGPAPQLVEAIFKVDAPQVLAAPFTVGEGLVVAQVTERKKPNAVDFEKQKTDLLAQARQAKQVELRSSFVQALKKQGSVVTHPEALSAVVDES